MGSQRRLRKKARAERSAGFLHSRVSFTATKRVDSPAFWWAFLFERHAMALTPKQEAFSQAVASGKSQSDAYRTAYNAEKMKPAGINVNACKLMADTKVALRVAELRKPVVAAAQITLASHLERLRALSAAAEAGNQYSAAITAEVARGKASGLYIEKVEHTGNLFDSLLAAVNGSSLKVVADE